MNFDQAALKMEIEIRGRVITRRDASTALAILFDKTKEEALDAMFDATPGAAPIVRCNECGASTGTIETGDRALCSECESKEN